MFGVGNHKTCGLTSTKRPFFRSIDQQFAQQSRSRHPGDTQSLLIGHRLVIGHVEPERIRPHLLPVSHVSQVEVRQDGTVTIYWAYSVFRQIRQLHTDKAANVLRDLFKRSRWSTVHNSHPKDERPSSPDLGTKVGGAQRRVLSRYRDFQDGRGTRRRSEFYNTDFSSRPRRGSPSRTFRIREISYWKHDLTRFLRSNGQALTLAQTWSAAKRQSTEPLWRFGPEPRRAPCSSRRTTRTNAVLTTINHHHTRDHIQTVATFLRQPSHEAARPRRREPLAPMVTDTNPSSPCNPLTTATCSGHSSVGLTVGLLPVRTEPSYNTPLLTLWRVQRNFLHYYVLLGHHAPYCTINLPGGWARVTTTPSVLAHQAPASEPYVQLHHTPTSNTPSTIFC